jgi:hypothetical protein
MLFERVITRVPGIEGKVTVGARDAIGCVAGRVVEPACCCQLLYGGVASVGVQRPQGAESLLSGCDHNIACGIFFSPARVTMAEANGSDDCEATTG